MRDIQDLPILGRQINCFVAHSRQLDSVSAYKVCNNLMKPSK